MIVTGISHPPELIHESRGVPSVELVYLAKKALIEYQATRLITSLAPGWEQALAKAAIELEIPIIAAIPFPGRDADWKRDMRVLYLDLLARVREVYRVSDCYSETALMDGHRWRADRADLVLALWEYDFEGDTFKLMDYALKQGVPVVNLWEDWQHLYDLRKRRPSFLPRSNKAGARIFESRG